jgi:hypothetical protein
MTSERCFENILPITFSYLVIIKSMTLTESGTVWGLSWKVTEHVVTYMASLVCYPNILSVGF